MLKIILMILLCIGGVGIYFGVMFAIHPLFGVLAIASALGLFNRTVIIKETRDGPRRLS